MWAAFAKILLTVFQQKYQCISWNFNITLGNNFVKFWTTGPWIAKDAVPSSTTDWSGWSEFSLGAQVRKYVSYHDDIWFVFPCSCYSPLRASMLLLPASLIDQCVESAADVIDLGLRVGSTIRKHRRIHINKDTTLMVLFGNLLLLYLPRLLQWNRDTY